MGIPEVRDFDDRRRKVRTELVRKSLHLCILLSLPIAYSHKTATAILLVLGTLLYVVIESCWFFAEKENFITRIIQMASRNRDKGRFVLGPVTLGSGAALTLFLFPIEAAVPAILALGLGDGLASLFGVLIKSPNLPGLKSKSVSGSSACLIGVFLSVLIYSGHPLLSLETALGATLLELLPIKDFDNIIIPLGTGILFMILSH